MGLGGERRNASHFLSAGQQQRLAIAGALAMDARCLAFDEATAMLDPEACDEVLALLDRLVGEGKTVLHVTHDMAEACRAERILVLDAGSVLFDGKPEVLLSGALDRVAAVAALGLPEYAALARALGLEAIARESAQAIAGRIAEAYRQRGEPRQAGSGQRPIIPSPRVGTSPSAPVFELRDARHAYLHGTANERVSLRGVDLAVPSGASLAFVGKTGSGKSTALQLLDGLVAAGSGRSAPSASTWPRRASTFRSLRMRAPFAIQRPESALFERYAGDDVAFGPRNLGLSGKALVDRVRESMEEAGLGFDTFRDRQTTRPLRRREATARPGRRARDEGRGPAPGRADERPGPGDASARYSRSLSDATQQGRDGRLRDPFDGGGREGRPRGRLQRRKDRRLRRSGDDILRSSSIPPGDCGGPSPARSRSSSGPGLRPRSDRSS